MRKLTQYIGPGHSVGGDYGYWEVVHLAATETGATPLCGTDIYNERITGPGDRVGLPCILRVDCADCSALARTRRTHAGHAGDAHELPHPERTRTPYPLRGYRGFQFKDSSSRGV